MTITAKDFVGFLPQYVWHMEEPVCEPPAIAMYYVSKLARNMSRCCFREKAETRPLRATTIIAILFGWSV